MNRLRSGFHRAILLTRKMSGREVKSELLQDLSTPVHIPVPWGHIVGKAWGDPGGQPVLALHGWLDNAGTFDKLAPLLSKDLYMVAIDLPGHGQSSHRHEGCRYQFVDYISDVKMVVDALGWKTFSFLCHSMGAGIATWFAAAKPDQVKNMILIENIGVMTKPLDDLPRLMGNALDVTSIHKDTKVYSTWDDVVKRVLEGHADDPQLTQKEAEILATRGTIKVEGGYRFSRDTRLKEPSLLYIPEIVNDVFLKNIPCPTLLIMAKDTFFNAARVNKRLESVPKDKVKLVQVSGGHHLHMYNHEYLAPLVNMFLLTCAIHSDYKLICQL